MKPNNQPSCHTPFQQALLDSVYKDYSGILTASSPVEASPKMNAWMQQEIQTTKTRINIRRALKAILIAAIIVVLLTISAFAVPAIREAIIRYFFIETDEHYAITFDAEQAATAPETILAKYAIAYVPDGYVLAVKNESPGTNTMLWMADNGRYIHYAQRVMPEDATDGSWIGIDYIEDLQSKLFGDYTIAIITGEETKIWVWTNNAYVFTLEFSNDLPDTEIENIFLSWEKVG